MNSCRELECSLAWRAFLILALNFLILYGSRGSSGFTDSRTVDIASCKKVEREIKQD